MDIHKNARLSYRSRECLCRFVVEQGATQKAAAAAFRVSAKTAGKWGDDAPAVDRETALETCLPQRCGLLWFPPGLVVRPGRTKT